MKSYLIHPLLKKVIIQDYVKEIKNSGVITTRLIKMEHLIFAYLYLRVVTLMI